MDKDVKQAKLHNALERAKDAVNFAWESGYREGVEAMLNSLMALAASSLHAGWVLPHEIEAEAARLLEKKP